MRAAGGAHRAAAGRAGDARPADDARARRQRRHVDASAVETFQLPLVPLDEQLRRAVVVTRGVVYAEAGSRPAVEEITLDPPGANEVQVRVEACGVCHTDLHVVETGGWGMALPDPARPRGRGRRRGGRRRRDDGRGRRPRRDRVARAVRRRVPRRAGAATRGAARTTCARSGACTVPPTARCSRPVLRCGTFADRVIVHEACAVKMPDALPVEQACLLACGFSTGAGAALWATPVQRGRVGRGHRLRRRRPGRGAGRAARGRGAIVAVDVVPEKLALALRARRDRRGRRVRRATPSRRCAS